MNPLCPTVQFISVKAGVQAARVPSHCSDSPQHVALYTFDLTSYPTLPALTGPTLCLLRLTGSKLPLSPPVPRKPSLPLTEEVPICCKRCSPTPLKRSSSSLTLHFVAGAGIASFLLHIVPSNHFYSLVFYKCQLPQSTWNLYAPIPLLLSAQCAWITGFLSMPVVILGGTNISVSDVFCTCPYSLPTYPCSIPVITSLPILDLVPH